MGTSATTQLPTTNQAGYSQNSNAFAAHGAVQSSPAEAVQKGAPAKAQRSGFGGERRSNGMTELLPLKAKRRIWSLRRRDGPKSRKMHPGEHVAKSARLPSYPPYKKPASKGRLWDRGPAKAQRSGFGGERRSSGTTELLPRKAKRRMWSLRRRGTPFSPIFRRATKDGVPEGPTAL